MLVTDWLKSTFRRTRRVNAPRRTHHAVDVARTRIGHSECATAEVLEDRTLLSFYSVMPYTMSSNTNFEIVGGFIETDGTTGTNLTIGSNIVDYAVTTTNGTLSQTFIPSNSNIINSFGIDVSATTISIPGGAQNSFLEIGDNAPNRAIWFHNMSGMFPFTGPSVRYNNVQETRPEAAPFTIGTLITEDTRVSLSGNTLAITDFNGGNSNDQLEISFAGATYTITDTGGLTIDATSIPGSTGSGTSTVTVPQGSIDSVTIDMLGGDDNITVNSVQPSLPGGLTVNNGAGTDFFTLGGAINTGAGNVSATVSGGISLTPGAAITTTTGNIVLNANTTGTTAVGFDGISLNDADIASGTGDITLTGTGGNAGTFVEGILLTGGSLVSTVDGNVTLDGTAQRVQSQGVNIEGGSSVTATGSGSTVTIIGTAIGAGDRGVFVTGGSVISSTGTGATATDIAITGTGNAQAGVEIMGAGTAITSVDGSISMNGMATAFSRQGVLVSNGALVSSSGTGNAVIDIIGVATAPAHRGVLIDSGADVTSTGTGSGATDITLIGTGGTQSGVEINGAGVNVTTVDGEVTINGMASAGAGSGINLRNDALVSSSGTGATISLTGTATGTADRGVYVTFGADVTSTAATNATNIEITGTGSEQAGVEVTGVGSSVSSTDGDITLNTDTVHLVSSSLSSTGPLTIDPLTAAATIGLGGGAGTLNLTDTELGLLQDGFASITIGDTAAGTGEVQINTATFTDPVTIAGGVIHDITGTDIDAGTNSVTLQGHVSPGQSPGILTVTGNLAFGTGATYEADIMGATPGTQHDQIDVTGTVNINNATLNIDDATFTAVGNELFVLINNDGADAVTGTFNGLPEGTNVTVGGQVFPISYVGGDGNDVVLGTPPAETEITLVSGTLTVVDVNGGTSDDNLQVFLLGTTYQFTENNGNIIDASTVPGATGSGTNMVTVPAAGVTGLDVRTLAGDDNLLWVNVLPTDYSVGGVSIDGGTGDDEITFSAGLPMNMGNADLTVTSTKEASVSGGGPINFVDGNLTINANAAGTFPGSGNGATLGATVNITGTGDVMVTGRGGQMGGAGVFFGGRVSLTGTGPTAGTITLDGQAGGGTSGSSGVTISNSNGFITSIDGDIMITGVGTDGGGDNYGIEIDDIDRIESTGTGADAATITLHGTAGNGTFDNAGLRILSGDIISALGDISLTGIGGTADPTSFASAGVSVLRSTVQIDAGSLQIDGTSNGGISAGVWMFEGEILSIGNGTVEITATSNDMGPDMKTQNVNNVIGGVTSNSPFTINADSIEWANLQVQSTGNLVIKPRTAATTIGLGGGMGDLNLDDTELGFLVDGFNSITIGDTAAGTGTVNIDTVTFTDPITISGGTINDATGTDIAAGTNAVTLDGNVSPGQSPGVLIVTGSFVFGTGATYEAEIMGITPGTQHDQIDVTGTVDINNATLNIDSTGFTATGAEAFILIENDAADAVTGTFNGLPEGASVTVGGRIFVISYVGGDGNDVELTPAPIETEVTLVGGVLTITDIDGGTSNDDLSLGYAGGAYTLTDTGGLSIDASTIAGSTGSGTSTVTIPDTSVTGINFNSLAGNDTIRINSVQASLPGGFTIAGGTGSDTAVINSAINVAGGNIDVTADRIDLNGSADLDATGAGTIMLVADIDIQILAGASLTTVNGGITLQANLATTTVPRESIFIQSAMVTSTDGDIFMQGNGGDNVAGGAVGIEMFNSTISTGGAGNITLIGGGVGLGGITNFSTTIMAENGDIDLQGSTAATGSLASGLFIFTGTIQSTGTGNVLLTGSTVAGAVNRVDVNLGTQTIDSGPSGSIVVNGNTYSMQGGTPGTHGFLGSGDLSFIPRDPATTIGVGSVLGSDLGILDFNDDELVLINAGFNSVTIGDIAAGTGAVDIDTATFTNPLSIAGGTINDAAGIDINNGTSAVALIGNVSPGQSPGILAVTGNFAFGTGATYEAEIMGGTPGTQHDQIDVTGTVNINNATLNIDDSGFTATGNETILLIKNDAADAVTGTFNAFPEGTLVTIGGQQFQFSYAGGDGNDVVLGPLPDVSVAVLPGRVAEDGSQNLAYTFTRTGSIAAPLTVSFDVGGNATLNTDYVATGAATFTATTGTVVIPAAASTATVVIDPTADSDIEQHQPVVLTVTVGPGYLPSGTAGIATGLILNDDDNSDQLLLPMDDPTLSYSPTTVGAATEIIDNGAAGHVSTGFTPFLDINTHDGDYSFAAPGNGSLTSTYTLTVVPGRYRISTTWLPNANRATNAPFSIMDNGGFVGMASLNQQLAPDDFSDAGSDWEDIATVDITGTTLTVELTDDASGYVVADAVRIEMVSVAPPPMVQIMDDGESGHFSTGFSHIDGAFGGDYEFAFAGTADAFSVWTFDVEPGRHRVSTTWLENFNRASNAPFVIYDGGSRLAEGTLNQEVAPDDFVDAGANWEDIGVVDITGGKLRVVLHNLANQFVISDAVRIEKIAVVPPPDVQVVDNGSLNHTSIEFTTFGAANGFDNDYEFQTIGVPALSTWTFDVTPGEMYRVSTTWAEHPNRATDAPFGVYDGNQLAATVPLNQELAPDDLTDTGGVNWEDLVANITPTNNTLTVTLSNTGNEYVIADAVRVEKLSPLMATASAVTATGPFDPISTKDTLASLDAAISYWAGQGVRDVELAAVQNVQIVWAALPGRTLGAAGTNTIFLDDDAAGFGWTMTGEEGHINLQSVVNHELGHLLGFDHDEDSSTMMAELGPIELDHHGSSEDAHEHTMEDLSLLELFGDHDILDDLLHI